MGLFKSALSAAAVALALVATPAAAKIVTVTWTGTVTSGIDVNGRFGSAGSDLAGTAFSAVYRFDTTLGATYDDGGGTTLIGGSTVAYPSTGLEPPGWAVVTINNISHLIDGEYMAVLATYDQVDVPGGRTLATWATSPFKGTAGGTLLLGGHDNPSLPLSYLENFAGTDPCTGPLGCTGVLQIGALNGTVDPDWVTIEVTSGVPEPETWALLIAGFGILGGALRSRRYAANCQAPDGESAPG